MRILAMLGLAGAASLVASDTSPAHPWRTQSPCRLQIFEQSRFTVCSDLDHDMDIEIFSIDAKGKALRSFAAFERADPDEARYVRFAMNAGMYDQEGRAIGLLVENGRVIHAINRNKGWGNFHLLPNGVLYWGSEGARIVPTDRFKMTKDVGFATQSGPMLVIAGRLHPKIEHDGESRHIRNGAGIDPKGRMLFVISEDPVSFGKFARFFRDSLHTQDALYLDGSVSSLWDPERGRRDQRREFGPMIVAFEFPE